jgi:hypothetical protein
MSWTEHVACTGENRNAYKLVVGKPEGKRPVRRITRAWEDNIKTDLKRNRVEGCKLIHVVQEMDQ